MTDTFDSKPEVSAQPTNPPGADHTLSPNKLTTDDPLGADDVHQLIDRLLFAQDAHADAEHRLDMMQRAGRIAHYFSRVRQAKLDVRTRQLQEAEYSASHDHLTGLYNRHGLAQLSQSYARGNGGPIGVLQLDVANFKSLNDKFGHNQGDDALRLIAAVLSASVRPGDAVVRLGGDEFAILLGVDVQAAEEARVKQQDQTLNADQYTPRSTSVTPAEVTEAVRSSILERIGFVRQENELWQESGVHLGLGAAVWDPRTEHIDVALQRADVALKTDKEQLHAQIGQYRKV